MSDETPDTGRPESLPASVVEKVRKAEGVAEARGSVTSLGVTVVNAANENVGPTSGAPTIAVDWNLYELRSVELTEGHEPRGPTDVVVDRGTADKHGLELGSELRTISAAHGVEPTAVALAWLLAKPGVVPLAGAKSGEQAAQNAKALGVTLSEAEVAELDAASQPWRVAS